MHNPKLPNIQMVLLPTVYWTKWRRGSWLKFNLKIMRPIQSGSRGMGFTEDVSTFMVLWQNSSMLTEIGRASCRERVCMLV